MHREWFGLNCSVHCVPRNDSHGHHQCDPSNGAKICHRNWFGPECSTYCIVLPGIIRRGGLIATQEMGPRFVTKRGMELTVLQDVLPRMTPSGITPVTPLMEVDCVTFIGMDQIVQYSVSHRTVN